MSKRRILVIGASLSLALFGSGSAMAGSFFGPCLYGAAYYREYPWRTRQGRCCCCPAVVCTPVVTVGPPATVEPAPAPALPPPRPAPQTPPG